MLARKKQTKYETADLEWERYSTLWIIVIIREA